MTTDILTAAGEEYVVKNALNAATPNVGIYNDATDGLTDSSVDPSTAITTEPTNTNYSRATNISLSAAETSTDEWGVQNDNQLSFDFSDQTSSENVDAFFILFNFTSTEGGGAGDWIGATAAMSQTRDIGSVDSIDIAAGDLQINFE